jgi:hypothetical protein
MGADEGEVGRRRGSFDGSLVGVSWLRRMNWLESIWLIKAAPRAAAVILSSGEPRRVVSV